MTALPGNYDFVILQGADFSTVLTWQDSSKTPINLTGYTARMQARTAVEAAIPFITLTTENGGITLGGIAGTITLFMSAAATAALTNSGVYDLELISGAGNVYRKIQGKIILSTEVTR